MSKPPIFILHAPEDHEHARALSTHLFGLRKSGVRVESFPLGSEIPDTTGAVLVPLLSASVAEWWEERGEKLQAPALVAPVRLRTCDVRGTKLGRLQGLPHAPAPTVVESKDIDSAWTMVVIGLREAMEAL